MGLTRESNWTLHCSSNMLPEKIGEYKILDALGSGTFGDVYKAEKDGKVFALKHIVPGSSDEKVVLQLEVDSHKHLPKHENIVGFVHNFNSWYRWNIVLEFCEIGTLESYVLAKELDLEVIKCFMLDMARGLDHLHSNNIVHRDIKPENILLAKGRSEIPKCKISDFGVARFISLDSENSNNGTNGETYFQTFRGSPYFISPEMNKGQYTKSCDIFSLGIVYYLMFARQISSDKRLVPWITGGTPFYRATDEQVRGQLNKHIKDETINQLVGSMLVIDLHGRISASSLVDELQENQSFEDEAVIVTEEELLSTSHEEELAASEDETTAASNGDVLIISEHAAVAVSKDKLLTKSNVFTKDTARSTSKGEDINVSKGEGLKGDGLPASTDEVVSKDAARPACKGEVLLVSKDEVLSSSEDENLVESEDELLIASEDTTHTPPKDKALVSKDEVNSASEDIALSTSEDEVLSTSEDEVFIAACVLFATIIMLVWLPFPLFVLCMAIFVVAGREFLPKRFIQKLKLLT